MTHSTDIDQQSAITIKARNKGKCMQSRQISYILISLISMYIVRLYSGNNILNDQDRSVPAFVYSDSIKQLIVFVSVVCFIF